MTKKILLIVYQFCPKGQIGTRRWSKFAKYLANEGYSVHVLCAKYPYRDKINWCHEVEDNPNIIIHRIAPMYPTYLLKPERNFWIKLFDRLFSNTLYYMDMAQHWGWKMIPAAKKLIEKEDLKNVIVSGGPFMTLYHAARLKKTMPQIRLIMDFRDPWSTWLPQRTLPEKVRKKQAAKLEAFSLPLADKVLFTTEQLRSEYAALYPRVKEKFVVLYNGYDEEDFTNLPPAKATTPLQMVYTGSLIKERVDAILSIVEALAVMNDPYLDQQLKINLYGFHYQTPAIEDEKIKALYDQHVEYKGVVSQQEVFRVLQEHDICLSINAKGHENLIGAKTFDYMGLGKKIFLISKPGELSQILTAKTQYVATYSQHSIIQALQKMKEDALAPTGSNETGSASYHEFNYKELTKQLINWLSP